MPRKPRTDYPGAWHHVGNRGVGKRPIFETRADMRYFLACVARVVRLGLIEVHSFCLMLNHFHLLVRSLRGELGRAMFLIENRYVRWFNRRRRRDGPLMRGRYFDGLIETDAYWRTAVYYIDANAAEAGLAKCAADYPFCSSSYFVNGHKRRWLVDGEAAEEIRYVHRRPDVRPRFEIVSEFIERRLFGRDRGSDSLDDLIRSSPTRIREKMIRRALEADGTTPNVRLAHPRTIAIQLKARREAQPERRLKLSRSSQSLWTILEAGLLTTAAGLSAAECAALLRCSRDAVLSRARCHRRALIEVAGYADQASRILQAAVRSDFAFLGRSRRTTPRRSLPP